MCLIQKLKQIEKELQETANNKIVALKHELEQRIREIEQAANDKIYALENQNSRISDEMAELRAVTNNNNNMYLLQHKAGK